MNLDENLQNLRNSAQWMATYMAPLVYALVRIANGTPNPKVIARNVLEDVGFKVEYEDE